MFIVISNVRTRDFLRKLAVVRIKTNGNLFWGEKIPSLLAKPNGLVELPAAGHILGLKKRQPDKSGTKESTEIH